MQEKMKKLTRMLSVLFAIAFMFAIAACSSATIELDKTKLDLKVGDTAAITATTDPASASVTWSSSDEKVATVADGTVTAIGVGSCTITGSVGKNKALCEVTVTEKIVYTITLDKTELAIKTTNTAQLSATVSPEGTAVTWASSATDIATVSSTGLVTGIKAGTATITASAGDASATCAVTVAAKARAVDVEAAEGQADHAIAGETYQLVATVMPAAAPQEVTWSVSEDSSAYATVSDSGLVTITALTDEVVIIATSVDEPTVSGTYELTIEAPAPEAITITGSAETIEKYKTLTLTAAITPEFANQAVLWSTSDSVIATVDAATGFLTAVAEGTVTITAKSKINDAVSASFTITVTAPTPELLEASISETSLLAGETAQITSAILPADASQAMTYTSSDEAIAKVSAEGVVTAIAVGTATITATAKDNTALSKTWTVTVTTAPAKPAHNDIVIDAGYTGERFSSTTYPINGTTEDFILGVNLFKDFTGIDGLIADGTNIYVAAGNYEGSFALAKNNVTIYTANKGLTSSRATEAIFGGTLSLSGSVKNLIINGLYFSGVAQITKSADCTIDGLAIIYCGSAGMNSKNDFIALPSNEAGSVKNVKIMYNDFKSVNLGKTGSFFIAGNVTDLIVTNNTFAASMDGSKATVPYWFYLGGVDSEGVPGASGAGFNGKFEFAANTVTNASRSAVKVAYYAGTAKTTIDILKNNLDGTIWNYVTSAAFEITGYVGGKQAEINVSYNVIYNCFRGINIDTTNVTDATIWSAKVNYNDFNFDGFQNGYVSNRIWKSKKDAVAGYSDTILVNADYNLYHHDAELDPAVAEGVRLFGVSATAVSTKYASADEIPAYTGTITTDTAL